VILSRAGLHFWEEPCISGTRGAGTVFFSGCNLRCVYCQNYEISSCMQGKSVSIERLREIYFELIAQGAHNIDLVTPMHYSDQVLKSLEEPPPKTIYFLLTDRPEAILPTIASRTQRVNLSIPSGMLKGELYDAVASAFAAKDSAALAEAYAAALEEDEDGDVALVRRAFYLTLLSFVRSMLLSGRLPDYLAYRNVELVEEAYRRSSKFINDEAVLSCLMDRLSFPKA
jgi:hypothetical protein